MRLPLETLLELMALSDGELTGEAKERAEALVNTDAQAREVVETMRAAHIGAWLKESLESTAALAGADRISDALVPKLAKLAASPKQRAQSGSVRQLRGQRSFGARFAFGAAGAGLVLAAAVLLYVGQGGLLVGRGLRVANQREAPIDSALSGATTQGVVGQVASSEGVVVDEIDSPNHDISLFEITSAGISAGNPRAASVVIWIEEGAK
jgi:anti-sigma factor RsiW